MRNKIYTVSALKTVVGDMDLTLELKDNASEGILKDTVSNKYCIVRKVSGERYELLDWRDMTSHAKFNRGQD